MLRAQNRLLHFGILGCDLALIAGAVWLGTTTWARTLVGDVSEVAPPETLLYQIAVVCVAWVIIALRKGFYHSKRTQRLWSEFVQLLESWVMALAAGSLVIAFGKALAFQPMVTFLAGLGGVSIFRLLVRASLRALRAHGYNYRRVILVGRGNAAKQIAENMDSNPAYGIRVVGSCWMPGEEALDTSEDVLPLGDASTLCDAVTSQEVDSVIVTPSVEVRARDVQRVLERCDVAGVRCFYAPDFLHLKNLSSASGSFGGMPAFTFGSKLGSPAQLAIKRAIDVVGAIVGLLVALPVFVAAAIAIKIYDRGPLFFRQERIGEGGRRFYFYKFRSMCTDAESQKASLAAINELDGPVFKVKKDPRVTPVGRFLRKYSLDELPQLLNVLRGDMSLVGPRPPVPDEVARYSWWQRRRISVRPGLTCVWQVSGRNKVSFEQWMEMDMFYIDNWSLWMDFKLMVKTMPALVKGTGM